jgi:leader peptidase (prepilin peptidase) / N-methyltransferase
MSDPLTWSTVGLICGPMTTVNLMETISRNEFGSVLPSARRITFRGESLTSGVVYALGLAALDQRFTDTSLVVASAWLAVAGGQLMLIDWACHRLPTQLTARLFGGGLVIFFVAAVHTESADAFVRAALAAVVVFTAALATALVVPGGFGAGDVRLLGAVGLILGWAGWSHVLRGLVLALLLGAVAGAVLLLARRISPSEHLAFGPAIVGGALLSLVLP